MLKKFLAGSIAVAALAFAMTASAYDFGTTTLKVGSTGDAVKAVQTVVGATVDGVYGSLTAAKVKVWQAANGLTADGVFGAQSKAVANASSTVTTTATVTTTSSSSSSSLSGDAGDLSLSSTSSDVEDSVKEGDEENVLGMKAEAEDSDIKITNLKVELWNDGSDTDSSEKISRYFDEVKVYLDDEEVGSADASDFDRDANGSDGDDTDLYTKSISLSGAIVSKGNDAKLYVALVASDNIDSEDEGAKWTVEATSIRYTDGTGAVMSDSISYSNDVDFDNASKDDDLSIKTSTSDPDDSTVEVYDDEKSDDTLVGAFKFDVDEDSSDINIYELPIGVTVADNTVDLDSIEDIIDSLYVEIDGDEYDADVDDDLTSATDTASYVVDLNDEDVTIEAGDTIEVKIYATFNDQDGNYDSGTTVSFDVDAEDIDAEGADDLTSEELSGSFNGSDFTLETDAVSLDLTDVAWSTSFTSDEDTDIYTATFEFDVTAPEDQDIYLPLDDFDFSTTGDEGIEFTVSNSGVATAVNFSSDDASEEDNGYLVEAGGTASFTLAIDVEGDGSGHKVTITSIWYQLSDITPDGTLAITSGLSDFKTTTKTLYE